MRALLIAAAFCPAVALAQMTEADIWAKVVGKMESTAAQLDQMDYYARQGLACTDGTSSGEANCESGADPRPIQRSDWWTGIDSTQFVHKLFYRMLARRDLHEFPALETWATDFAFDPHWGNAFHEWYKAVGYPAETLWQYTVEGVERTPAYVGAIWLRGGEGWEKFNHVMYFLTWVLALENTRGAPIIPESEAELIDASLAKAAEHELHFSLSHAAALLEMGCEKWPVARYSEIAEKCDRAVANLSAARDILYDAIDMLEGAPCGQSYPCTVEGLDVHEFPGHAASYWTLSPDKTEGLTFGAVARKVLNDLAFILRLDAVPPADTHEALSFVAMSGFRVIKAWKFFDGVHEPLGKLVAREHERHH